MPIPGNDNTALAERFLGDHPLEAARVLEKKALPEVRLLLETIASERVAPVLKFLPPIMACSLLEQMPPENSARMLAQLPLENTLLILKNIRPEISATIQKALPPKFFGQLRKKMAYPERTAGSIMNPQLLTVPLDATAAEASKLIREYTEYFSYYIFVVDRSQKFKGYVITRQILLAKPQDKLAGMVMPFTETLNPYAPLKDIVRFPGWQDKHAIPVVDKEGYLLGAISYQSLKQIEKLLDQTAESHPYEEMEQWTREVIHVGMVGMVKSFFATVVSLREKRTGS